MVHVIVATRFDEIVYDVVESDDRGSGGFFQFVDYVYLVGERLDGLGQVFLEPFLNVVDFGPAGDEIG